jgi:hypothetical protein
MTGTPVLGLALFLGGKWIDEVRSICRKLNTEQYLAKRQAAQEMSCFISKMTTPFPGAFRTFSVFCLFSVFSRGFW